MVELNNGKTICRSCIEADFPHSTLTLDERAEACYQAALEESQLGGDRVKHLLLMSINYVPSAAALAELALCTDSAQEAECLLRRALLLNAADPVALANMPLVLAARGLFTEALAWLELHECPDLSHQTLLRARLLRALGHSDLATTIYRDLYGSASPCCQSDYSRLWHVTEWVWGKKTAGRAGGSGELPCEGHSG